MAVSKNDIVELVLSLSSSEKRYFKANHPKDNDYIKLFDIINENSFYDDEKIREQFKSKHISSYSSVVRTYLKDKILESLRSYHIKTDIKLELSALIDNIRLLYLKGLYTHQRKEIKKAKSLAKKHDLFEELLILNNIEQAYWNLLYHFDQDSEHIDLPFQQGVRISKKLDGIITSKFDANPFVSNHLAESSTVEHELSIYEQVYKLLSKANEACKLNQYSEALSLYDQSIKHWLANPTKINLRPALVIHCYISYANCLTKNGKPNKALEKISNIKSFALQLAKDKTNYRKLQFEHFLQLLIAELGAYSALEDYNRIINIIDEIKELEKDFPHSLNSPAVPASYRLILYYNFAYSHFQLKNYQEGIFWIEKFDEFSLQEMNSCIKYVVPLRLMLYFENRAPKSMENYLKTGRKSLHKLGKLGELEQAILQMFNKLIGKRYEHKPHILFEKFIPIISKLETGEQYKYFPLDILSFMSENIYIKDELV